MIPKHYQIPIWIGLGAVCLTLTGVFVFSKRRVVPKVDLSNFDSPDQKGSGQCMDRDLLRMLQGLANKTKLPIFEWINSGARTPYWNRKVGGVRNSSHLIPSCSAADIKAPTIAIRNQLVRAAREVGFTRIGVGRTFVHLDTDRTKTQYVAWGYPSGSPPPINPFV